MTPHRYLHYSIAEETRTVRIIENRFMNHHIHLVLDSAGSVEIRMIHPLDRTIMANIKLFRPDEAMLVAEQLIALCVEPATINSAAPPQWLADLKERCQQMLSQQFVEPEEDEPDEDDSEESAALA